MILRFTGTAILLGTLFVFLAEPEMAAMEPGTRLLNAFFQAMTAATTVGFNSVPIGAMAPAAILMLYGLMIFGASPSGTGGGLKVTTLAVLIGLIRSTLKRRDAVRLMKRPIPPARIAQASASFAYYFLVLGAALTILLLTETGTFEAIVFEAISALGTVGLSMGLTGGLSDLGKLLVVLLMLMGRVGILTFGIAVVTRDEARHEEADNEVVL